MCNMETSPYLRDPLVVEPRPPNGLGNPIQRPLYTQRLRSRVLPLPYSWENHTPRVLPRLRHRRRRTFKHTLYHRFAH
jgi:hypothetical protein